MAGQPLRRSALTRVPLKDRSERSARSAFDDEVMTPGDIGQQWVIQLAQERCWRPSPPTGIAAERGAVGARLENPSQASLASIAPSGKPPPSPFALVRISGTTL